MRMLKKVNRRNPMKIIQMKSQDFKDFGKVAQHGKYNQVPFTKVKALRYKQKEPKILAYKTQFSDEWVEKNVLQCMSTRRVIGDLHFQVPDPPVARPNKGLSEAKKADILSMLKFMPASDKEFMSLIVSN